MQSEQLIQERYRLRHPLGRGGMAEVWCACDERLQRDVAIKVLAPGLGQDPEGLVRFFSEAQSVARISHPNVVSVLDFGDHEGRPYLVMEYVEGGSVAELKGQALLPERAVEIVWGAARGAGAAHAVGLIHRDIKPANILLTSLGEAKLADFGIASSTGSERLTATGQAIGSPHYISPEQASGVGSSARSDVYSLGIVLYELLAGRPPFDADNVTALAIAHVDQEPPALSTFVEDVDPALEALVMRCLSKDPGGRFEDGSALAAALEDPDEAPALFPVWQDEFDELEEAPPVGRRILTGIAITGIMLALLGSVVWGVGDRATEDRARSYDQETVDRGDPVDSEKKRPSPTPTTSTILTQEEAETVGTTGSPTPSPSAATTPGGADSDRDQRPPADGSGGGGTGDGAGEGGRRGAEPDPEPSPEPTQEPSPEPEPSPEATQEPSPEPTGEQDAGGTNPGAGSQTYAAAR